jgi:eukaryotic-like serine/threonine-protein kinase
VRRFLACLLLTLAGLAPVGADPVPPPDSWPVFRGNPGLTGVTQRGVPGKLGLVWTFKTSSPIRSSPVIAKGKVIVGSLDGNVYCLALATGREIWKHAAGSPVEASPLLSGEAVYVGTLGGDLLRLDALTGKLRWRMAAEGRIAGSANIHEQGARGDATVLVGSYDGNLYGVGAENGRRLWTYHTGNYINGAPAVVGNLAVFGGCDALLHLVSVLDGSKVAEVALGSYAPGSVAVSAGRAYVGTFGDHLLCVDLSTGMVAWDYGNGAEGGGFFSSPAVSADAVVIGSRGGFVCCVDARTGKLRWKHSAGGAVDSSPVIVGDTVFFATGDGRFVRLSLSNGKERWSYEIGEPVGSSPAVSDGMVIVGCDDGALYAFGGS